ncbi:hypothetical protein EDD85DRAFT_787505 [Armillaria nabsnona]|nr:hypothetical protein EDD85DRAFT_787505 [Armillaria nabsnona]
MLALLKVSNQYCTICKLDSHPTFNCSFMRDNAIFQGPTKPIIGGNFEDRQMNSSRGTVTVSTGTRGGSNSATYYGLTKDGAEMQAVCRMSGSLIKRQDPEWAKQTKKYTRKSVRLPAYNKWNYVNQVMNMKCIAIMVVGEAHLNNERRIAIENMPRERALLVETCWHKDEKLSILGVYAPVNPVENMRFWGDINEFFLSNPNVRKLDIMAGDMNITEDPIDRFPARQDYVPAVDSLDILRTSLHLMDGWRSCFPSMTKFTWRQPAMSLQSCLDRTYPETCIEERNPQKLWEEFSKELWRLARERAKVVIPAIDCKIQQIEGDISQEENMQSSQRDDSQSTNLMALHAQLDELTWKHHQNQCEAAQAKNILEREVISKYWSGINKPLKPRDAIQRLRIPG